MRPVGLPEDVAKRYGPLLSLMGLMNEEVRDSYIRDLWYAADYLTSEHGDSIRSLGEITAGFKKSKIFKH